MIIIPFLNGYNWEYTPFSDKPIFRIRQNPPRKNEPLFAERHTSPEVADFRGYGYSTGRPSLATIATDGERVAARSHGRVVSPKVMGTREKFVYPPVLGNNKSKIHA